MFFSHGGRQDQPPNLTCGLARVDLFRKLSSIKKEKPQAQRRSSIGVTDQNLLGSWSGAFQPQPVDWLEHVTDEEYLAGSVDEVKPQ
jgi:hypothetical protein